MIQVLFYSAQSELLCYVAEKFAKEIAREGVQITSGCKKAQPLDKKTITMLSGWGIVLSNRHTKKLSDLNLAHFDIMVALTDDLEGIYVDLPGMPLLFRWNLADPLREGKDLSQAEFLAVQKELRRRIENIFTGDCLAAFLSSKRNNERMLDHLADGIIVHDVHRTITWFNQSAERITGYPRSEVMGRDCHDVFPGNFCGSKSAFCEDLPKADTLAYPIKITTKDGRPKRIDMSVVTLHNERQEVQGVMACLHDVTEVAQLRQKLKTAKQFHGIIGREHNMQAIYELIGDLAESDCSVLIQGDSGTGKELVANAIHQESRRAGKPFVTVNCGALPEGVLESELFGHVRGAFTGAVRDKKGRFELADGGTIFLDEVGELSPNIQVKLLRVLQEGVFEKVGGEKSVTVDVRVISATNKDLRKMVQKNQYREDLFYRLCVVPVNLPPLRERRNDIPLLIDYFIERFSKDMNRPIRSLSREALHILLDYAWPGNIRELQNALQYAFIKCKDEILQIDHFPPEIISYISNHALPVYQRKGKLNTLQVKKAIEKAGGSKIKAARLLKVSRATLYRFLQEHHLD
jgi:sigma-54 dependent transcriptional regulator, acetoin dehydrogenase operon transcriptional activator AcoR